MHKIWILWLMGALLSVGSLSVRAEHYQETPKPVPDAIKIIQNLLQQPEERIDLATAKLTIDHIIDPSLDISATLNQLNRMATEISWAFRPGMWDSDKLFLLKNYLYQPGEWNDGQAFRYDFDDPMGTDTSNKLLHHYLATKKGNCVSMPILLVILGDKLGLDVTIATMPSHLLVKYRDRDTGVTYNLEATGHAEIRDDASYLKYTPMTKEALDNGVYLAPLSKKVTVATMATLLNEHYEQTGQYQKSIALAGLLLSYYPKDVYAMIKKGNGYSALLQDHLDRYKSIDEIPPFHKSFLDKLAYLNSQMFAQAEALGWREQGPEAESQYLERVNKYLKRISLTE